MYETFLLGEMTKIDIEQTLKTPVKRFLQKCLESEVSRE